MSALHIAADFKLRTPDDLVLTTTDRCDATPVPGAQAVVVDLRDGAHHIGHVEEVDEKAGHVFVRIDDEPTRLERFRADHAFSELMHAVVAESTRSYATGDRAQSGICIDQHLTEDDKRALVKADRFTCPVCGHLLKERR